MIFRLTRLRLRAEWLLLLFSLLLLIWYVSFCGADIRTGTDLYSYNQFHFRNHKNINVYTETGFADVDTEPIEAALAHGVDPKDLPEKADLLDVYEAVIRVKRDELYDRIFSAGMLGAFPILDGIAMLLLCPLFRKRRIGQFLSAGFSRRQVFISFTLTYFAFPLLMWGLSSFFWLSRFHIPFSAFWEYQLAWLGFDLFCAALAYLAALLLPKPAAAFFVSLGVWLFLLLCIRSVSKLVLLCAVPVVFAALLIVPWRQFRKRGFTA